MRLTSHCPYPGIQVTYTGNWHCVVNGHWVSAFMDVERAIMVGFIVLFAGKPPISPAAFPSRLPEFEYWKMSSADVKDGRVEVTGVLQRI